MPTLKLGSITAMTESSGTVTLNSAVIGSGGLRSMQVLTTGTTYVRPTGITTIKVYCTGAGGTGGHGGAAYDNGGGAGGGGTAIRIYDVSSTTSITYAIGPSAGTQSASSDGPAGGTSSFSGPGQTITATGGAGGQHGNNGNVGNAASGVGVNGQLNLYGSAGDPGNDDTATNYLSPGTGGDSFWGGGGAAGRTSGTAGSVGYNGGGGTGGRHGGTGGAGGAGIIVVEEYA